MRAGLYTRLSEEDRFKSSNDLDSESIQNQKNMLVSYAVEKEWQIYDIYNDDDYKGSDRNRPEWNRLLEDAKQRKFDVILCKTQSRFTRELEIVEKYIHGLFPIWGIRFVSIVDNADTNMKGNKKSRQINGLVNEWYLEDLSENERAVFKSKQTKGEFIGTYAPFGYIKDPENHNKFVIDESAAKVVQKIFRLYLEGYGHAAIARALNAEHILPPYEYKTSMNQPVYRKRAGDFSTGLWKDYTVRMILTRQSYIGDMVQSVSEKISYKTAKQRKLPKDNWIIVPNTHEPIIEREVFFQVQEMMRAKCRRPKRDFKVHIFAGKVQCGKCGAAMLKFQSKGHVYLHCGNQRANSGNCDNRSIRLDKLEEIVLGELKLFLQDWNIADEAANGLDFKDRLTSANSSLLQRKAQLRRKLEEQNTALASLYLDKVRGSISETQFQMLQKQFEAERQIAESALKQLEAEENTLLSQENQQFSLYKIALKYTALEKLDYRIVQELVDFIEICGTGDKNCFIENRNYEIRIHWKF